MKEKKNCKIVQDLLPNYIEKLTNEETNNFIKEHLKECEECQKIYENMKKDFEVNSAKRDDREVKYIKKYSKKLKILKTILLIIVLIYALIVGRRTFIMFLLSEKTKENYNDYKNYYAKVSSYHGNYLSTTESYHLGEDYLTTITTMINGKEINKLTIYKKGTEKLALSDYNGKKYIQDSNKILGGNVIPVTYVSEGLFANLQYAFIIGIDSTYCNGKECYVIKGNGYERYIDKKTGWAVRELEKSTKDINRTFDVVEDYEYKFNTVKDSDIVKPDATGYILNQE